MDFQQWIWHVLFSLSLAAKNKNKCRSCAMIHNLMKCAHACIRPTLTFNPTLLLADRYMLALSSGWLTNTGSCKCRELSITASTSGGADAVSAIKGAFVNARNLLSLEKDSRKSLPLRQTINSICD